MTASVNVLPWPANIAYFSNSKSSRYAGAKCYPLVYWGMGHDTRT